MVLFEALRGSSDIFILKILISTLDRYGFMHLHLPYAPPLSNSPRKTQDRKSQIHFNSQLKKKKSYLWHSKVALLRFALSFHFILPVEKIPKHKNLSSKEQKFVCIGHCRILST